VVEINKVLDSVGGTEDGLVKAEKAIRGQLKLINYAKYFCVGEDLEDPCGEKVEGAISINNEQPEESEPESEV